MFSFKCDNGMEWNGNEFLLFSMEFHTDSRRLFLLYIFHKDLPVKWPNSYTHPRTRIVSVRLRVCYGKSQSLIGKSTVNRQFSIAHFTVEHHHQRCEDMDMALHGGHGGGEFDRIEIIIHPAWVAVI